MTDKPPQPVHLKDYSPPACLVDIVRLRFDLRDEEVLVEADLHCRRNPAAAPGSRFVLYGRDLDILSLALNGADIDPASLRTGKEEYTLAVPPQSFELHCRTKLRPQDNTSLEGLYRSGSIFCTQCEAEGFRNITLFPDRPDVLARYTTTIEADRSLPVLLANGNLIEAGDLENGRHYAVWEDPFPKPSYLFALVAGDLGVLEDRFTTASGREVLLQIYSHHQHMDKCAHAMAALKQAMRWDEETYGLEYDLDRYMIVAVDDFNMGAMENKGLNVFNSKFVLCRPDTATDSDYEAVAAVIAHEYFHNWTGNRVTCRDWFQLSLKEGLTVFRDQQFSADRISGAVQRIHDAQTLRTSQFKEDSGPLAHPVRPQSYIEINNFYTVTVYEKGAEVIRMLHTLLGQDLFRKGLRQYLAAHDGSAATTDDFVAAMEAVSGRDLSQFRRWYDQAGTPVLSCDQHWNPSAQTFTLTCRQHTPPTPGQTEKLPQHIPVSIALLAGDGKELPLRLEGDRTDRDRLVLELTDAEDSFTFTGIGRRPVVSLLRNFSAPVRLDWEVTAVDRCFLFRNDTDPFNRWEAGQQLAASLLLDRIAGHLDEDSLALYLEAFAFNLSDPSITDETFRSRLLTLPSEEFLADRMAIIDPEAIHRAREQMRRTIASACSDPLHHALESRIRTSRYRYTRTEAGRRRMKNLALAYLCSDDNDLDLRTCYRQFLDADNMTDAFAALQILSRTDNPWRQQSLDIFAGRWRKETLVMDKWFALQATAPLPKTLHVVRRLLDDPAFSIKNPNRVRALLGGFAHGNPVCFHAPDGSGYAFIADQVLILDSINPQIASRLATCFSLWRRFDRKRQGLMSAQLDRIASTPALSPDTYEVVSKTLTG